MAFTLISTLLNKTAADVINGGSVLVNASGAYIDSAVDGLDLETATGAQVGSATIDGLVYGALEGVTLVESGVFAAGDMGAQIVVNGSVQGGLAGISIALAPAGATNAPTVSIVVGAQGSVIGGGASGIEVQSSAIIDNAGIISSANGYGVSNIAGIGGIFSLTLENSGSIHDGVQLGDNKSDVIANAGSILGGLQLGSGDTVTNSGVISGGDKLNAKGFGVMTLGAGTTFDNTGTISSGLDASLAGDTIDNSGKIIGGVNEVSASLNNSGAIGGTVAFVSRGVVTNTGTITGALSFDALGFLNNSGVIDGNISAGALGADVVTVINSGSITGSLAYKGTASSLTNHGQIYGNVALAAGDYLNNTGVIHGNLTLGASDTAILGRGAITGSIAAAATDKFEFAGQFGHETIGAFVAGAAATHDTMQFAADDFGAFAAVQAAMTQVGADVVIRLDASDAITLTGLSKASLVAADFSFV